MERLPDQGSTIHKFRNPTIQDLQALTRVVAD
jgi:hypothetical protein